MRFKKKHSLFILPTILPLLTSCNAFPYDKYECKKVEVELVLNSNGTAQTLVSKEIEEYEGKYYSKKNDRKVVSNLIAGDVLEIYYDDTSIKRILVDEINVIELQYDHMIAPCCDGPNCEGNCTGPIYISNLKDEDMYITNFDSDSDIMILSDGTYKQLAHVEGIFEVYGTYKKEDLVNTDIGKRLSLFGLYDYNPRTK